MPSKRPARCLFRLSDAKVVFFHYTANDLQVFFIVSCIFFVFSSLGVLCRGCFLVFFLRFLPSSVRAASYYIYVRARGRGLHGWRARITHRGRGWFLPWGLMVDPLRPPASSPLKRGQRRNAGGIIDGRRVVVPDDPRRAGLILQAGGVLVLDGWSPSGCSMGGAVEQGGGRRCWWSLQWSRGARGGARGSCRRSPRVREFRP